MGITKEVSDVLNKEFKVLDKGFLKLIDFMGDDERIVQSARISYLNKRKRTDKELLDYLIRNEQTSPFEQVVFVFHIKAPIFVARQWMRHRTARINEVSGCYSFMEEEFYVPLEEDIKIKDSNDFSNKDKTFIKKSDFSFVKSIIQNLKETQISCYKLYKSMIDSNIVREIARIALPLSLYTEWYWQIDLNNLFRFIRLRLDLNESGEVNENSPEEMREYAKMLLEVIEKVVPISVGSFKNHILNGKRFSHDEVIALSAALDTDKLYLKDTEALKRLKGKLLI